MRWLEQSGFLLHKVETYDSRYREAGNAYEWATPTGGHGLRFATPRLIVTSRRVAAGTVSINLPPPLEREWQLNTSDKSRPTAVLLSPPEVNERAKRALQVRGAARQGWEIQRIEELRKVGGDSVSAWADVEGDKATRTTRRASLRSWPSRRAIGWAGRSRTICWSGTCSVTCCPHRCRTT